MRSFEPVNAIRVLIVESSAIHCELLAEAIGRDRRFQIVGFTANSCEAAEVFRNASPDVLLVSHCLEERPQKGFELLRDFRAGAPDLKSVVLLDSARRENIVQAFRSGARGVFCKNSPVKTLCKCIATVHAGQIWANAEELGFLVDALSSVPSVRPVESPGLNTLSARELEVVNCLAEGLSNREIAARLNLSSHTVKNYMFRIFDKLGVSSRVELLSIAFTRPGAELQEPEGKRRGDHTPQLRGGQLRDVPRPVPVGRSEPRLSGRQEDDGDQPRAISRFASA